MQIQESWSWSLIFCVLVNLCHALHFQMKFSPFSSFLYIQDADLYQLHYISGLQECDQMTSKTILHPGFWLGFGQWEVLAWETGRQWERWVGISHSSMSDGDSCSEWIPQWPQLFSRECAFISLVLSKLLKHHVFPLPFRSRASNDIPLLLVPGCPAS